MNSKSMFFILPLGGLGAILFGPIGAIAGFGIGYIASWIFVALTDPDVAKTQASDDKVDKS